MEFLSAADTIKQNFLDELQDAASEKQTSLRFIKHTLQTEKLAKDNGLFQVLVIGGSVFRKALVKKDHDQLTIVESTSEEHPLLTTREMLLTYIAEQLYQNTDIIALNFAYPLNPIIRHSGLASPSEAMRSWDPEPVRQDSRFRGNDDTAKNEIKVIDGILLSGGKKDQLQGLAGQNIGASIEQYVKNAKLRDVVISVANDVICLLLSGYDYYPQENLVGAIMGTGTNISFFDKGYAVNIQSGGFDKFTPSKECLEVDRHSLRSGFSLFEKETAGLYLYQHFNLLIKKHGISYPPLSSTKELTKLISSNPPDLTPTLSLQERETGEKEQSQRIARFLMEKSAAYFSGQIAGLAAFKQSDITVIMEGSMYWENPLYQKYMDKYLQRLSLDYKITIVKVENSSIIGAARLIA